MEKEFKTIKKYEAEISQDSEWNTKELVIQGKLQTLKDVVGLIKEDISVTKKLDDDIEWKYNVLIVLGALIERIEGK